MASYARYLRAGALIAAALAFALAQISAASAQTWPSKVVRIVVPSSSGGSIDIISRLIASELNPMWGNNVIVENRPGGNFVVGTDYVAKSPPDGYTLLMTNETAVAINPVVIPSIPYNPETDLVPIIQATVTPVVLYVNAQVPAKTAQELVALLKANPGKYNNASGGTSTTLIAELFKSQAGVDFTNINYKGGSPAMASLAAGETQISFFDMASGHTHREAGRIRVLATAMPQRSRVIPDLPTLVESGLPNYYVNSFIGAFAPAKTPPAVIAKINSDMQRVLNLPNVRTRIENLGVEVQIGSGEQLGRIVKDSRETWAKLVKEKNLVFDP